VKPFLEEVWDILDREGLVILLLDDSNRVVAAKAIIGSESSCQYSRAQLFEAAVHVQATKAIFAHSHPVNSTATPSDVDVEDAAGLYFDLREAGLELTDDLVLCSTTRGRELRSVKGTARFREMIKEY
jgi:DNA repair protein RadC